MQTFFWRNILARFYGGRETVATSIEAYFFVSIFLHSFFHKLLHLFLQRLQRRSDEEEDAMKNVNENSSSTENKNHNHGDSNNFNNNNSNSNSNSNSSIGGVIAGGSWVIDSMQPHITDNEVKEKEVEKVVEKLEGGDEENDYVVDIYMQSDITEGEDSNVPISPERGSHIPVVQVDG